MDHSIIDLCGDDSQQSIVETISRQPMQPKAVASHSLLNNLANDSLFLSDVEEFPDPPPKRRRSSPENEELSNLPSPRRNGHSRRAGRDGSSSPLPNLGVVERAKALAKKDFITIDSHYSMDFLDLSEKPTPSKLPARSPLTSLRNHQPSKAKLLCIPTAALSSAKHAPKLPPSCYDDDLGSDIEDELRPRTKRRQVVEKNPASDDSLASIGAMLTQAPRRRRSPSQESIDAAVDTYNPSISSKAPSISPRRAPPSKATNDRVLRRELAEHAKATEKERRKAERDAERLRKNRDKEEEKERKRKEKEAKQTEKQLAADLADVNKLRTSKKDSSKRMIIELPDSFPKPLLELTERFMKEIEVETRTCAAPFPGFVRWKRKVDAEYDEASDMWKPKPLSIERESHVLCLVDGKHFANMVARTSEPTLDDPQSPALSTHVSQLRSLTSSPDAPILYVIQGLEAYTKKQKSNQNKAYRTAVLAPDDPPPSSAPSRRRKAPITPVADVPEAALEAALLSLQLTHNLHIAHLPANPLHASVAEHLRNVTESISTIPARRQRSLLYSGNICTDIASGAGARTGVDAEDTFLKMLQEIRAVTPAVAQGVLGSGVRSVEQLLTVFEERGGEALEDCWKGRSWAGGFAEGRVGRAVSRRIWRVAGGRDPLSYDV